MDRDSLKPVTTKSIVERLREAAEDYANPEQHLMLEAADDLDRTRYHLAMVLCEYTEIRHEALPTHVKNALDYYNLHNHDCQVTHD